MTVRRHILPPHTTALERAVDQAMPRWDLLAEAVEPISVRGNAAFQPWLAAQWQIAQFAQYFDSVDALITAALPWLFERGNAASVRRALAWLGYDSVVIEEEGAYLHIDLGRLVHDWELAAVAHVVRASLPAHVAFWRVYHGHDLRAMRLDAAPLLDSGLLDNDSGVPVDVAPHGSPVKASQGTRHGTESTAPTLQPLHTAQLLYVTTIATYADRLLLDAWVLDSELLADTSLGVTLVVSSSTAAPMRGLPQVLPPADGVATVSPWTAAAPHTGQQAGQLSNSNRSNDTQRTWTGRWDAAPWRPFFETNTYEET